MAGVEKGGLVVECVSARLVKVRIQLEGKSNGVSFVVGYAPTLGSLAREKDHFLNVLDNVGTAWMRTPRRANDRAGALTVRSSAHTGVIN